MKQFLLKVGWFLGFLLVVVVAGGFILPTTPRVKQSLLFGKLLKDSLLIHKPDPRIILMGGSGISFSIDSKMIKDSLGYNPVNTGIHQWIGLIYMLDQTIRHVKEGDIVVLIPEYQHFFGQFAFGSEELLRMVMDVNREDFFKLRPRQYLNIAPHFPKYALSKFKPSAYKLQNEGPIYYTVNSFNEYGDVYAHRYLKGNEIQPYPKFKSSYNESMITYIEEFSEKVKKKNALLFVTFPSIQYGSFKANEANIKQIETDLNNSGLNIIGTVDRYLVADSLLFDGPYHLNGKGVEYRTLLLINDLKQILDEETK